VRSTRLWVNSECYCVPFMPSLTRVGPSMEFETRRLYFLASYRWGPKSSKGFLKV